MDFILFIFTYNWIIWNYRMKVRAGVDNPDSQFIAMFKHNTSYIELNPTTEP